MKKWKWFIVVILVIAVVVAAIYAESTKKTPVRMARVRTGPIQTWVEDKAVTTLPNVRLLTMPMAGRLEPIELEEGDPVSRDQVVARMDTADLETEVAIATARLGEVRAEMTLNAYHDLEQVALVESDRFIQAAADMVSAAEETIKASQEEVDFAEWWFGATKELSDKGGMARVKLKEAQKDFVTARVTLAHGSVYDQCGQGGQGSRGSGAEICPEMAGPEGTAEKGAPGTGTRGRSRPGKSPPGPGPRSDQKPHRRRGAQTPGPKQACPTG